MTELYKVHRPKQLDDVVGQPKALSIINSMVKNNKIPHAIMLSGPSGTGKTTIARILRKHLKCYPSQFHEMDIGDLKGVDNIRDIRKHMMLRPMAGKVKVWFLDEVAELTLIAQKALLKRCLEDTPAHVYFILATTDPQKLITAIRTRCTEIPLKSIDKKDLASLILSVWGKEKDDEKDRVKLSDIVVDKIVENSEGSARMALVLLDSIICLESEEDMLEAIEETTQQAGGFEIAKLLLNGRWPDVAKKLKAMENGDAEGMRRIILSYMRSVLLGGGRMSPRASLIMGMFERPFYDGGKTGMALLANTCYECFGK